MTLKKAKWGKLPDDIYHDIKRREWLNLKNFKLRLLDERKFPIKISLCPPSSKQAIADIVHFQLYINKWKQFPYQQFIEWQPRIFRTLAKQQIPMVLTLNNMSELLTFLGEDAQIQSQKWQTNMQPLLNLNPKFYPILVEHLSILSNMHLEASISLSKLLNQLYRQIGAGLYLRALPIKGVDTKFLENNLLFVEALLDVQFEGELTQAGGLLNWLGCLDNPKGWLMIKPLCPHSQASLSGLPILQLDSDTLKSYELPANNILVIENIQSGLALPKLNDTIAVIGGGNNISWLTAKWLINKRVGYWGDIDSWGLKILGQARFLCSHIQAIMMDEKTLLQYQKKMVNESASYTALPSGLTETEMELFDKLQSKYYLSNRLEQERLPNDYVSKYLSEWLSCI